MIRSWLKLNTTFIDLLKNSTVQKNLESKWCLNNSWKFCEGGTRRPLLATAGGAFRQFQGPSGPNGRGDGEGPESAVTETPARTELFEMKGPAGSAFLIEVFDEDLEEVKDSLTELKGDLFRFDRTVIEWFTIKCCLTAEPERRVRDAWRLAQIHAISSGSEEVHALDGRGQFLFVSHLDRTARAKRILRKLGYRISGIMYRFQPKEKVRLEDRLLKICEDFLRAVERLPKVISVTHNL